MDATVEDPLAQLILATAAGDRAAFAELYRQTSGRMYAIPRRIADQAAADALQEAYLRVWRRAASFDPMRGHSLHWIGAIVRNTCLDMRRTRTQEQLDETHEAMLAVSTPAAIPFDLETCLGELESLQRRAILLAVHYGFTHEEIQHRLGTPLGTLKSLIRRGLIKLRDCLG